MLWYEQQKNLSFACTVSDSVLDSSNHWYLEVGMTKKDEALKLALSVLNEVRSETFRLLRNGQKLYAEEKVWNAIFVIKQALADHTEQHLEMAEQPEQVCFEKKCWTPYECDDGCKNLAQSEQPEPQPHCNDCGGFDPDCPLAQPAQPSKPLPEDYTALEQALTRLQKRYAELEGRASKPWVGLTEEERDYIWHTVGNSDAHGDVDGWSGRDVMNAIEAKLREKNA